MSVCEKKSGVLHLMYADDVRGTPVNLSARDEEAEQMAKTKDRPCCVKGAKVSSLHVDIAAASARAGRTPAQQSFLKGSHVFMKRMDQFSHEREGDTSQILILKKKRFSF